MADAHEATRALAPALPPGAVDLGRALRGLRKARGLTLGDLALMADISGRYLSMVERGCANPTWLKLCNLAGALGVSVSAIAQDAESAAQATRAAAAQTRAGEQDGGDA